MYVKTVDEWLRKWIETTGCRRDLADQYFDNPQPRDGMWEFDGICSASLTDIFTAPLASCCDNCLLRISSTTASSSSPSALVTPPPPPRPTSMATSTSQSAVLTPALDGSAPNFLTLPTTRRDAYLQEARALLKAWRHTAWVRYYSTRPFGAEVILPDTVITALAYRVYQTVEELKDVKWLMSQQHGKEVLEMLHALDVQYAEKKYEMERVKKAREQAERVAKQREREEMKEREKVEKEAKKLATQAQRLAEAERKQQEKEQKEDERKRQRELGPPTRPSRAKRARVTAPSASLTVHAPVQTSNIANLVSD